MASADAMNFFIGLFVIIVVFSSFFYLIRESVLRSQMGDIRGKGYEEGWNDAVKHILDARNTVANVKIKDEVNE